MAEAASQVAPRTPADGTAEVWWARRQDAAPALLVLLDPVERERWAAYRGDADRERFLVGCALAKTVTAACTGQRPAEVSFDRTCRQCGQPHGKPVVGRAGLEFSVAHSGDLVAVAVATAVNWGAAFLVSEFFLSLVKAIGEATTFWLFAAFCVLGFVWVYFGVPETRGRSLEQIEEFWKTGW